MRPPWTVIVVAAAEFGVAAYGLMLLISPAQTLSGSFVEATGTSIEAVRLLAPKVHDYFLLVARMLGGFNLGFGLLACAVVLGPFRAGERWARWALVVGNLAAWGTSIAIDLRVGFIGLPEAMEFVLAAVLVAGLVAHRTVPLSR